MHIVNKILLFVFLLLITSVYKANADTIILKNTEFPAKNNSQNIALPGSKTNDNSFENQNERSERLESAGIIAKPTPVPTETPAPPAKTSIDLEIDKLKLQTTAANNGLLPADIRSELSVSSWTTLVDPKDTRFIPDMAYGINLLVTVGDSDPLLPNTWRNSHHLGIGVLSFNGCAYVNIPDYWQKKSPIFAETNSLQILGLYDLSMEKRLEDLQTYGLSMRFAIAPVRMVNTKTYTDAAVPFHSEARTHNAINWGLFQANLRTFFGFAHLFEIGLASGIYLISPPYQVRASLGIDISFLNTGSKK